MKDEDKRLRLEQKFCFCCAKSFQPDEEPDDDEAIRARYSLLPYSEGGPKHVDLYVITGFDMLYV